MPVLSVKALEVNISEWIFHYQDEYLDLNDSGWSEELNKKKKVQISADWSGVHYIIAILRNPLKSFHLHVSFKLLVASLFFFFPKWKNVRIFILHFSVFFFRWRTKHAVRVWNPLNLTRRWWSHTRDHQHWHSLFHSPFPVPKPTLQALPIG